MRRNKFSLILVFVIIIAIVGISIVIPEVSFSESYSGVGVEEEWTPVIPKTPTQTITASSTSTLQMSFISAASPTLTTGTNCVYPSEYWEEHPEVWLDLLVGNTIYSKDEIRLIFDHPSQEIHQIILKQLYLSNLNIFSGANPKVIQDVLGDANQWLQEYLPDEQLSEEFQLVGVQLAQTLTEFNTGLVGPGYCPPYEALAETQVAIDQTATQIVKQQTPTPSLTATATATRYFVTLKPTTTATKTKKPDKDPEPTDPPRPTQEPDTPVPPPQPTDPPPPQPTVAPPENTPEPTDPPKPTPTPAS